MENSVFILIIIIVIILNVGIVLLILKNQPVYQQPVYQQPVYQQHNAEEHVSGEHNQQPEQQKPVTLVYKENKINIIDPEEETNRFRFFKQFPTIWGYRYNFPREYPPFYGYGTIYRPYEDRYHDLRHDPDRHRYPERDDRPVYQNTINNNNYIQPSEPVINRSSVVAPVDKFDASTYRDLTKTYSNNPVWVSDKKMYSNNPVKDFLSKSFRKNSFRKSYSGNSSQQSGFSENSAQQTSSQQSSFSENDAQQTTKPQKTVFTKYHPADGKKHTGFVKDIQQGDTNYKVFIPDKGTQEGDVYTTEKTFDVKPEPIKETVEIEGKKIDVELSPSQSLEENPVVDTTQTETGVGESGIDKSGVEKFTARFNRQKQMYDVVLSCGKKIKLYV